MHESLEHKDDVEIGSEKSFGLVFASVFIIISLWPLIHGMPPRWWAIAVSVVFLAAAFFAKPLLKPLNILWFKFGLLLYKIVNPIVMGILYYLTIVPMGLVMKAIGKDPLNRRFNPDATTYWIEREPHGPEPDSMKNQF